MVNAMHSQEVVSDRALQSAWGLTGPSRRGPQARYTLRDVVETAVGLTRELGLEGVSFAALARELGLTTTALYRYVDTKDDLVDLMIDAAVGAPRRLGPGDWSTRAERWARRLLARYTEYPWLAEARTYDLPRQPHQLAWLEQLLDVLAEATVPDPAHTAVVLDGLARSFSRITGVLESPPPPPWLSEVIAERYPRVAHELSRARRLDEEFGVAVAAVLRGAASAPTTE